MSSRPLNLAIGTALLISSSVALAIPFSSIDTRSMAMGGAGVAVDSADAAPLFNPALLSVANEKDRFSILLPTVGIHLADPDKLGDSVDAFQNGNYLNNLQSAITTFNSSPTTPNATIVSTDIQAVSSQLALLSNKPITVDGGLATVVAVPGKKLGFAFYANATAAAGGSFQYKDATTLTQLGIDVNNCAGGSPSACNAVQAFNTNNLTSGIDIKGVTLGEIGFSLSREFEISGQNVALGITPKIVKAQLFDSFILVNSSNQSNVSGADNIADYNYVNFDLGAAENYNNGWRTGFVIKNIIPKNLDFKYKQVPTGDSLKLMPQARIGVSHANSWSTVALDVDLTHNDPAGFENSTQYIALGGELNAWSWAQLRAGYRIDMVNSARNITSVGLGFSPFGVHADLAVAGNATEIGASFQLGFRF